MLAGALIDVGAKGARHVEQLKQDFAAGVQSPFHKLIISMLII
jgi:hypothetical protein